MANVLLPRTLNGLDIDNVFYCFYAYFLFKKDRLGESTIALNDTVRRMGYSMSSHKRTTQTYIFSVIDTGVKEGYIEIMPDSLPLDESNIKEPLHIQASELVNPEKDKFIVLEPNVFKVLMQIAQENKMELHRIFNVYILLRTYMPYKEDELKICYPSLETLATILSCTRKTIKNIIDLLEKYELIFTYLALDKVTKKGKIVFSLVKYKPYDLKNTFIDVRNRGPTNPDK